MSLSYEPAVKITFNTAQDISNEILGASIQFCDDLKYPQNFAMTTYFWAAFFSLSARELVEEEIIDDVKSKFVISISKAFPQFSNDPKFISEATELLEFHLGVITYELQSANSQLYTDTFLELANAVSRTSGINANPDKENFSKSFDKYTSNIKSNIYQILRGIDNGFSIQYRSVLNRLNYSSAQSSSISRSQENKKSETSIWKYILCVILAFLSADALLAIILGSVDVEGPMIVLLVFVSAIFYILFHYLIITRKNQK